MKTDIIKQAVDEYTNTIRKIEELKAQADEQKARFEKWAAEELKDSKQKTAEYWGTNNAKVTVTRSATVKPIAMSIIKDLLGDVYGDMVKEDKTYRISDPFKRLLTAVFMGDYTEGSRHEVIQQITDNKNDQQTLAKKLKGKYDKDRETIINVAGVDETAANYWAYMFEEIVNWERLKQILDAAEWDGSTEEAIDRIKAGIIVDEGIKVGTTAE